jgi:hypothetical protein
VVDRAAPWPYRPAMHKPLFTRVAAAAVGLVVIGTALPASAALDKSSSVSAAQLKALSKAVNKEKHLTFEATYTSVAGGQTQTVTIAQAPPKSYFSAGQGAVISTGSTSYYCSTSGGTQSCLSASGANPIAGLETLFSPAAAITALNGYQQSVAAHVSGVKISESSGSFAGQAATCVTATAHGQTGKYCVTKQGILAYAGAPNRGTYFQLTKYSKSPPSSLFTVSSASTVTLPGGVTIP